MSTMLNFKHGLYAKLPQAISNGTIYVTTDEKAMYVDLNDQRIRLSQIITLDTFAWQNLTPPYSTEAFYYVSDANALLKYNGTQWVQLNSTADLENSLRALGFLGTLDALPATGEKGQICTVGGLNYVYNPDATTDSKWVALSNVGGKFLDLEANIASLDDRLSDVEDDISALEPRVEAAEADIDILELVTGYKGKVDAVPTEAGNVGDVYLVGNKFHVYVPAINNDAAHWAEVGNESARIESLKKRVEEVALAAGDKTAIEDLTQDLATLSAQVNDATNGLAATKAIADRADSLAATAVQTETFNTFKSENTAAIADAKKAGTDAATELATYKTQNDGVVSGINERLTTVEGNYLKKDGSVAMEGALDLNGHKIVNVVAPESSLDAANKSYVDTEVKKASDAASAADGKAVAAAEAAATADAKAVAAAEAAAAAQETANSKATIEDVKALDYATKTEAKGYADSKDEAIAAALKDASDALTKAGTNEAAIKAMDGTNLHSFADVENALGEANNTYATKTELANAKTAILGEENYDKTVKDAYTLADKGVQDAAAAKALAETKVTMAQVEAKNYITIADVEGKDYATKTEAQGYANNAAAAVQGNTNETVKSVDTKAVKNQEDIAALQSSVDSLSDTIELKIQAADAMVYMGTISSKDELPTSQVSVGATYKAIAEFDLDDNTHVYIGDLLIARGTEDDSLTTEAGAANENFGFITEETLTWDHVSSGYRVDYVPSLAVAEETANDNRVKVNLTSAHAGTSIGDLGNIIITAADNSAVTVSAIDTANKSGTIAIGMAWGSF